MKYYFRKMLTPCAARISAWSGTPGFRKLAPATPSLGLGDNRIEKLQRHRGLSTVGPLATLVQLKFLVRPNIREILNCRICINEPDGTNQINQKIAYFDHDRFTFGTQPFICINNAKPTLHEETPRRGHTQVIATIHPFYLFSAFPPSASAASCCLNASMISFPS